MPYYSNADAELAGGGGGIAWTDYDFDLTAEATQNLGGTADGAFTVDGNPNWYLQGASALAATDVQMVNGGGFRHNGDGAQTEVFLLTPPLQTLNADYDIRTTIVQVVAKFDETNGLSNDNDGASLLIDSGYRISGTGALYQMRLQRILSSTLRATSTTSHGGAAPDADTRPWGSAPSFGVSAISPPGAFLIQMSGPVGIDAYARFGWDWATNGIPSAQDLSDSTVGNSPNYLGMASHFDSKGTNPHPQNSEWDDWVTGGNAAVRAGVALRIQTGSAQTVERLVVRMLNLPL